MKKQEIISVLYDLYKITGFRISLHDINHVEIAAYPKERLPICAMIHKTPGEYEKCVECDHLAFQRVLETKETVIYKCRYGLTEAISPLYNFGMLTGFLMMGQISDTKTSSEQILDMLIKNGADKKTAEELLETMPRISEDMTRSYVKIMTICAQYLTLSNAVPGEKTTIAEAAKKYIYENLDKKITIKNVCDEVGCSKSTLVTAFKKEFGTTINAAITDAKLDLAKKLLISKKMTINEIAQLTGFYDQSYFSKVFSQECGISPSEYRKESVKI